MKKLIIFFCFLTGMRAFGQEELIKKITLQVDSILEKVKIEKDDNKRFELFLDINNTGVEAYPNLILDVYRKLYRISQENKDIMDEACAWSFAGQGYRLSGNFIKALECHHKAVALAEQTGNKALLGLTQNQMAHIYKDREEYEKALRLYTAAKGNALEGKNKDVEIWPEMNLGAVYLGTNDLDSSLFYSKQAYEKSIKAGVTRNLPYILLNIAGAYSKKGDIDQAISFYNKAVDAAKESQSVRFINLVYEGLAEHFQRNKMQDSSLLYAKRAIEVVQNSVFSYMAMKPSKLLTDIYETSNADSTLKYLRIYRTANDSLFNTRANQQLQMMTFDEEQRQQGIADEKTKYQNKIKMGLMLAGLAVFSLIVLILYRNNKQKQNANKVLERTLDDLKTTQTQLVQSEKMASLGELTAGIAHEIQNPLNFVNNFSEVNSELIAEMKQEMDKGNFKEAKTIADDIEENEKKIVFHGKRADGIVKGMLQHSRSSSGVKEPTDINALCDEYLRLSYHGLRAKDKSFNATIKTDFDNSIGNINIIPQDIGRVVLNLLTNAFYVVDEKKTLRQAQGDSHYEPTVSISTKKIADKPDSHRVEIKVSDNGNGIPDSVKEKIFQPFFTTKPTGQGTGLGLSLSYDIITKGHSGQLKVETKEGEGTTFIIILPL